MSSRRRRRGASCAELTTARRAGPTVPLTRSPPWCASVWREPRWRRRDRRRPATAGCVVDGGRARPVLSTEPGGSAAAPTPGPGAALGLWCGPREGPQRPGAAGPVGHRRPVPPSVTRQRPTARRCTGCHGGPSPTQRPRTREGVDLRRAGGPMTAAREDRGARRLGGRDDLPQLRASLSNQAPERSHTVGQGGPATGAHRRPGGRQPRQVRAMAAAMTPHRGGNSRGANKRRAHEQTGKGGGRLAGDSPSQAPALRRLATRPCLCDPRLSGPSPSQRPDRTTANEVTTGRARQQDEAERARGTAGGAPSGRRSDRWRPRRPNVTTAARSGGEEATSRHRRLKQQEATDNPRSHGTGEEDERTTDRWEARVKKAIG